MTCDEVRELAGAFAADAVDVETRKQVLAHVRECGGHVELGELRTAALAMAMGAEPVTPRAGLRARVLASAGANGPAAGGGWWPARRAQFAIAAAVVALVGVGAVAGLGFIGGSEDAEIHTREIVTDDGIRVWVEARPGKPETVLRFEGLEQAPAGEEYVAWAIRGSEWIRVGQFEPDADGTWSGAVSFAFDDGDALCLTLTGTETPAQPFGVPLFMEPI